MLRHSVLFKLKHPKSSPEEKLFFDAALKLSSIAGVRNFECLQQTSKKNNFEYGISMEFDSAKGYKEYSNHPDHVAFVQSFWLKYVRLSGDRLRAYEIAADQTLVCLPPTCNGREIYIIGLKACLIVYSLHFLISP